MADSELQPMIDKVDALIEALSPKQRKALAKDISRGLRGTQAKRIKDNKEPDGTPYEERKPRKLKVKRLIRFIYPTSDGVRDLKSFRETDRWIIGFDRYRGGIRTFRKDRIERYVEVKNQTVGTTLRERKGQVKKKMFQKIVRTKHLKPDYSAEHAGVAFTSMVSRIARTHHYGLKDKVGKNTADYPERQLLGATSDELKSLEDTIMKHIDNSLNG